MGGRNKIKMRELREALEKIGLRNVKSYIQSGNLAFHCDLSISDCSKEIASVLETGFSIKTQPFVMFQDALAKSLKVNPYREIEDGSKVHIFFLSDQPEASKYEELASLRSPTEESSLKDKFLYLHAPDGVARSKFLASAEKKLGVQGTARNMKSVRKIAEMATGLMDR